MTLSKKTRDKIVALWYAGASMRRIAKRLGMTSVAVKRALTGCVRARRAVEMPDSFGTRCEATLGGQGHLECHGYDVNLPEGERHRVDLFSFVLPYSGCCRGQLARGAVVVDGWIQAAGIGREIAQLPAGNQENPLTTT